MKTTGKLGDVMKESIDAASSFVRSIAPQIGVKPPRFDTLDIHVHVPEGATPKDGPSAGIAMVTSIVSVLTQIPVRKDIAMTGEVTLRGNVLAIGGLKEKLLAALRGERGLPPLRMMPLACPDEDWRGRNDWDQQFLLGEDLLVAPVAFYGNTRAIWVPNGRWFDVLAGDWVRGPALRVHDVATDAVPLFLRAGARLVLRPDPGGPEVELHAAEAPAASPDRWCATLGAGGSGASPADAPGAFWMSRWFGADLAWRGPEQG
jgi:hypothetical protein